MRILYLENSPGDADPVRRELLKVAPHFRLEAVATPLGAMERLRRLDAEPLDLILIDVPLSDGDALKLLAHVRDNALPLAVVVMTGAGDPDGAVAALKAGADDYVVKREGYLNQLPGELEKAVLRFELSRREQALRESRDTEYRRDEEAVNFQARLLNTIEQAVIASDMDGVVIFWNQFAERLYGWSMEEAMGRKVRSLLRPMDSHKPSEEIWAVLRQGQSWAGEFTVQHRDGSPLQIWVTDSPIFDSRGNLVGVLGISHDITERKKAESFREGQSRVLEMIAAGAPLADILMSLVLLIESQTEGMLCSILLLDADGEKMRPGAAPSLPELYLKAADGAPIGPRAGSCGTAMYRGEPVVVTDILDDPLWEDYRELALAEGLRACWSTPILSPQGRVLGSFAMYYRTPRGPTIAEQRLTDIAIHIAGIAIARQRAEEALKESEERFRTMADATPIMVWMTDNDKLCTYLNKNWLDFRGRTMEEELGNGWAEGVHPADYDRCLETYFTAFDARRPFTMEYRLLRHDGEYRWVLDKGAPYSSPGGVFLGYIGSALDITERKLAEEALKESEDQVRIFVEHTPVAVAMFDREMRYMMTSRRWLKDNDLGEQNIIGRSHYEVVPDLPERWKEGHRRCLAGEVESCEEDIYQHSDGSTDWVRWETRPWYTASGEVGGVIMFSEIITERKRAEDELLRLTVRLFTLQDEERRRIARELHDVTAQNLFAISINLTKLHQPGSALSAEQKRVLEECLALTEQSLQEIRTLSYLLHPPLLDQAGLVSALQWYVDGFIKRSGIYVDLLVLQDIGRLPSEIETALFRVVQESLTNIHRHSGSSTASIRLEKTPDEIMLQIIDQGRGMPIMELPEPADEISELGVGIPGMRQRLRQLGGRLEVESNEQGTTIVARVPLAERKLASA